MTFDRLPPTRQKELVAFLRLPLARQKELVAFLQERHGWSDARAVEELRAMDHAGVAYVGVEARLARRDEKRYDPLAEMFVIRG